MNAQKPEYGGPEVPHIFILEERTVSGRFEEMQNECLENTRQMKLSEVVMKEVNRTNPQQIVMRLWVEYFLKRSNGRISNTGICIKFQNREEWQNRYGTSNSLFMPWRLLRFLEKILEKIGYLNEDIISECWVLSNRNDEIEDVFRYTIDDAYTRFELFVGLDRNVIEGIRNEILSLCPPIDELKKWVSVLTERNAVLNAKEFEKEIRIGILPPVDFLKTIIAHKGLLSQQTLSDH